MNHVQPARADGRDSGRACPRCGGTLSVEYEVNGDRVIECQTDCGYEEHEPYRGRWSALHPFRVLFETAVIPRAGWVRLTGGLGLVAALIVWDQLGGSAAAVVGVAAFLLLAASGASPSRWCASCGQRVSEPPGFCRNCGRHTRDAVRTVPGIAEHSWPEAAKALADRLPDGSDVGGGHLTLRYQLGSGVIDRLVDGRERAWKRVLDLGVLLGIAVQVGAVVGAVWFAVSASPAASSSSGSGGGSVLGELALSPELAWLVVSGAAGVVATVLIHEWGHGLAFRVAGYDVEEYELRLLAALLPVGGVTKPGHAADGGRGPLDGLRVDAAGALANVLTGWPFVAVVVVDFYGMAPAWLPAIPWWASWFVLGVGIGSIVGVMNLLPIFGADGGNFLMSCYAAVIERAGVDVDALGTAAFGVVLTTVSLGALLVAGLVMAS